MMMMMRRRRSRRRRKRAKGEERRVWRSEIKVSGAGDFRLAAFSRARIQVDDGVSGEDGF